jgi:hypothetical protein
MVSPQIQHDRSSKKWIVVTVFAALVLVFAALLLSHWRSHTIVVSTIDYVVVSLCSQSGWSPNLVRGIVILVTIPFFWAVAKYTHWMLWLHGVRPSLRLYRNPYGIIIVSYVGLFFIAMYFASRDAYASKWCADTPEGIRVFDAAGSDPVYGIALKPCGFDQIVALRRSKVGISDPQKLSIADVRQYAFFDSITGKPRVWYYKLADGSYAFYDKPGKYPATGQSLLPIDEAAIQDAARSQEAGQAQLKRFASEKAREPYVDTSIAKSASNQVAVLVFPKGQQEVPKGSDQSIASTLSEQGFDPVLTFFKAAFVSEGRAQKLFSGDWSVVRDLGIGGKFRYIVLAESGNDSVASSQFDGLITSNVTISLKCLNTATHSDCGSTSIISTGAGYSKDASIQNAIEKAHPQLVSFAKAIRQ